jgi:hypothetical protein
MASDDNTAAPEQYARGWGMGDNFKQFVLQFRKEVETRGGLGVESDVFRKFNTFIFRLVQYLSKQQNLKFLGSLLAACGGKVV